MNDLQLLVGEYEDSIPNGLATVDWNSIQLSLVQSHDWSEDAARELVNVARNYGSFFLRNATAIAIACNHQDGELNY